MSQAGVGWAATGGRTFVCATATSGTMSRGGSGEPWVSVVLQGEDGIRYYRVTGVQTCALPIGRPGLPGSDRRTAGESNRPHVGDAAVTAALADRLERAGIAGTLADASLVTVPCVNGQVRVRSEERRVGEECRSRWAADH